MSQATMKEKLTKTFPDLQYRPLVHPANHPVFNYHGLHPDKVQIFPKGHVKTPGYQASSLDVIWEQDRAIPMRDGIKLYTDVFRPASEENKVPAIIPWSPYGKVDSSTQTYDIMGPWRMGIPFQALSGYETFEGPNPLEWCRRGYAVVDIDARGAGHSEGDISFWGEQEAIDIYDSISWIAEQPWCNGAVVMMGNSWLAISQITFASRFNHPNLKAIAPWEGLTDPYKHHLCRGGKPAPGDFIELITGGFAGTGNVEDVGAMLKKRPLYDAYWESKAIVPENIRDIPMYLTASYSTGLHCDGSFETFERASTSRKWLRVHATQEWHDIYTPKATDDLQRFFDFYAKGAENGWETDTPPVRLTLLGYENSPSRTIVERPESQWPPARQSWKKYYLDATTRSLTTSRPQNTSSVSHEGHSLTESSDFTLHFDQYTELCGRPYVKLFMSCADHDDFDVVVQIRKISAAGELLESLNWSPMPKPQPQVPNVNVAKHLGQQGMLRASHHVTLINQDDSGFPSYDHRSRQPVLAGTVIPLIIPIWPVGMVFEAGEGLMLRVAGHDMCLPEVEMMRPTKPVDENKGAQVVYTGGDCDSFLMVPVISDRITVSP